MSPCERVAVVQLHGPDVAIDTLMMANSVTLPSLPVSWRRYVAGGSIASNIDKFGPLEETLVKIYTKQILKGLEYLHERRIMHRDIKVKSKLWASAAA